MRADRLISILLLLQQRKKITAQELAEEMGVSIRTIYRDMVVLSSSGFPVFAEKGPGGGCCIIEDFKSSIRTLSDDEVDALQIMRIPESLTNLSAGKDLQRALLKVMALIPDRKRDPAPLFIDWDAWPRGEKDPPADKIHLLYEACNHWKSIHIEYLMWNKAVIKQDVQPYGIVAKAGEWYLVYRLQNSFRSKNIFSLRNIVILNDQFEKQDEFDLEKTWKKIISDQEAEKYSCLVRLKIKSDAMDILKESNWDIPFQVVSIGNVDLQDWVDCEMRFEHLFMARTKILSWGGQVKVVSPDPLRLSVLDFAKQVIDLNEKG